MQGFMLVLVLVLCLGLIWVPKHAFIKSNVFLIKVGVTAVCLTIAGWLWLNPEQKQKSHSASMQIRSTAEIAQSIRTELPITVSEELEINDVFAFPERIELGVRLPLMDAKDLKPEQLMELTHQLSTNGLCPVLTRLDVLHSRTKILFYLVTQDGLKLPTTEASHKNCVNEKTVN